MKTKLVSRQCPLLATMGRSAAQGVPPRVLIDWLTKESQSIPDVEYPSARVVGTEFLRVSWEHTMTPAEVQAERLATLEDGLAKLRQAFGQRTTLTADELREAKTLLDALGAK